MRFTTDYFERTTDPVMREIYFLITGGEPVGKSIKEDEKDAKSN
jgi:hypothetical protein